MTGEHREEMRGSQVNIGLAKELQAEIAKLIRDRRRFLKRENDMRAIRLTGWILFGMMIMGYMIFVIMTLQGRSVMPSENHAAVIDIGGVIGADNVGVETHGRLLRRAFSSRSTRAVVLHINSGGGSASEAERLGVLARRLADQHKKPLIAHIDGVGASAAYMLAAVSDRVYASQYSLTGSIGAVIRSVNWNELAQTLGVAEVSYASSGYKTMLSPWNVPKEEHEEALEGLAIEMANRFADQVESARGEQLKVDREQLLEARIYSAADAYQLGLIDGITTLETLIEDDLGLSVHQMTPRRNWYETISEAMARPVMQFLTGNQAQVR